MKILVTANSSFNIVNFRAGLIKSLMSEGHEVVLLVPFDEYTDQIRRDLGCKLFDLKMNRRGTSPLAESKTLWRMLRQIRQISPDVIIGYTIKNNIYGGLASRLLGIPILPNITGLGSLFSSQSLLALLARKLYSIAFKKAPAVFFQNDSDAAEFLDHRIVPSEKARILPGSGVDLKRFSITPLQTGNADRTFLLIGRMLWEKGVGEFVEASRKVRESYPNTCFRIVGGLESPNEAAIPLDQLKTWEQEYHVEYFGHLPEIKPVIEAATCVVLPTYYKEGTPRSLIESAAMGRPLITTDTPGCRNVVLDTQSGYLVAPQDVESLSHAMMQIAGASDKELAEMGQKGRTHIEANYDEEIVITAYKEALALLPNASSLNAKPDLSLKTLNIPKGETS